MLPLFCEWLGNRLHIERSQTIGWSKTGRVRRQTTFNTSLRNFDRETADVSEIGQGAPTAPQLAET